MSDVQRVRVVSDVEVAGGQATGALGVLFAYFPVLWTLLTLVFVYLPLWWVVGVANESVHSAILSVVLGLAACGASLWLLRKLVTRFEYSARNAAILVLLLGLLGFIGLGNTDFGRAHAQDLIGGAIVYVIAVVVLFLKLGTAMRWVMAPVMGLLHFALMAVIVVPLVAGSARLLLKPVLPNSVELLLARAQYPGGAGFESVFIGDHRRARAACEAGSWLRMSDADVLAGKPVPEDRRSVTCQLVRPYTPFFKCPEPEQASRVHASVLKPCEKYLASVRKGK